MRFRVDCGILLNLPGSLSVALAEDAVISLPGVKIDGNSVQVPGVSIDSDGVNMPEAGIKVDSSGIKTPGVKIDSTGIKSPAVSGGSNSSVTSTDSSTVISVQSGGGQRFINSDSSRANFSGKNLSGAVFKGGDFSRANFSGSNLTGAIFTDVDLSRVDFSRACMLGVRITGGDLTRTTWSGAIVTGMTRVGGDYSRAELSAASDGPADCSSLGFSTSRTRTEQVVEVVETRKFKKATEITSALSEKNSKIDLTVNFATDSDRISAEAHSQVLEIANALKSDSLQGIELRVEGHTDHDGSDDYNVDLSYRRAVTVVRTLTEKYGVSANRLKVKGFGESMPVASNESEGGKALNRRVALVR